MNLDDGLLLLILIGILLCLIQYRSEWTQWRRWKVFEARRRQSMRDLYSNVIWHGRIATEEAAMGEPTDGVP